MPYPRPSLYSDDPNRGELPITPGTTRYTVSADPKIVGRRAVPIVTPAPSPAPAQQSTATPSAPMSDAPSQIQQPEGSPRPTTGPAQQPPPGPPLVQDAQFPVMPIDGVDQPRIPDRADVQAIQNTAAIQRGLNRQMDAGTQAIADRMGIVADGTYANAVRRGVSPDVAGGMFDRPYPTATAPNLTRGGAPIGASLISQQTPLSPDARRAFAENQTLSVRQAKARDERQRLRQMAQGPMRAGDRETTRALLTQAASIGTPGSASVGTVQAEREGREQEIARTAAENPPRVTGGGQISQPRESLPPATQAKVDAMLARMRAAGTQPEERQKIQEDIFKLIDGLPAEQKKSWFTRALEGAQATAGQAAAPDQAPAEQTQNVNTTQAGSAVLVAVSPDGTQYKTKDGRWISADEARRLGYLQ